MEQMLLDGLSSCYVFVFYFYPKPPIFFFFFFFFFSCFCFSHPKHRNPTELNRNRLQSVDLVFIPYKSVLVLNVLKLKFSVRCKNCLQHRPNRTDYTPNVWLLIPHTLNKLILHIIFLSVKQILGHVWFLEPHTLGKLILPIICLNVK